MQVVVNGLLTNYMNEGRGKPVVFLHGWGSEAKTFAPLMAELKGDYQVIALDLPGFGATEMPNGVWGLSDYAKFVAAFLKKLNIVPYGVVAHSNGAAIAIKALGTQVIGTERLFLLGAAGIRPKKSTRKLLLTALAKTGKAVTVALPAGTRKKLRGRLYHKIGSDYRLVEGMEETFKKTVAEDVLNDASSLKMPVFLVYGEEDDATPPLLGELFRQQIPNASLEVISGAGHFVHLDAMGKVNEALREFLK